MTGPTPLKDGQAAIKATTQVIDAEYAYQRALKLAEMQYDAIGQTLLEKVDVRAFRKGVNVETYLNDLTERCRVSGVNPNALEQAYIGRVSVLADLRKASVEAAASAKLLGLRGQFLGTAREIGKSLHHLEQSDLDIVKSHVARDMESAIKACGNVITADIIHLHEFAEKVNAGTAEIADIATIASPGHVAPPTAAPHAPAPKAPSAPEGNTRNWIIGGVVAAVVAVGAWMLAAQNEQREKDSSRAR